MHVNHESNPAGVVTRMKHHWILATVWAVVLSASAGSDWLQFRGTDGTSVSEEKNLPRTFGEGRNVAWKAALPGRGPSSPIVVGRRVVITAASGPRQDRLHVLVFDAASGELAWERQLWATGHVVFNPFGGVAANTPASDGRLIFAFFSSNDLACFDLDGNLKWLRGLAYDYPNTRNDVGMASSPLVLGDTVIVQLENGGESFVAGLDVETGETRWRQARSDGAAWTSPIALRGRSAGEDVALLQSRSRLTAHDPRTGRLLWKYEAPCHTLASATTCGDVVYLPSHGLHALRGDPATGGAELLWHEQRLNSGNTCPVVHDGRAYTVKPPGIVVCGDARDGSVLWQLRLKGPVWATPVAADGLLYVVNHDGLVQVVRLGEEGELVGESQIDAEILASPAVAGGAIYFRSNAHLWKVAFAPDLAASP